MAVGPLTGVAESIVQFVDWGITILVIMIGIEVVRFVFHGPEVASAGEGGKQLFGWVKGKWGQGQEKAKKLARREREFDLLDYDRENEELKLEETIQKQVEHLNQAQLFLRTSAAAHNPDLPHSFEQLAGHAQNVHKDFKEITKRWRKVRQSTRRHERAFKAIVNELKKDTSVPSAEVSKLQALDRKVLERHTKLEEIIPQLAQKLEALAKQAENAHKTFATTGTSGLPDLTWAQEELKKADFDTAPALAEELVKMQQEDLTDIRDLFSRMKKY